MTEKEPVQDRVVPDTWRRQMERGVRGNGFSGYGDFDYKDSRTEEQRKPRDKPPYQM